MSCPYESSCLNSDKCYRCVNQKLLKIKGMKGQQKTAGLLHTNNTKVAQADDSWKDLEQQVADKLNNIPTVQEARRSRASGALWFEKKQAFAKKYEKAYQDVLAAAENKEKVEFLKKFGYA